MTKEEIFAIWAPGESPWSRWVKPVLFAHLESGVARVPPTDQLPDMNWAPPPGEIALVIDLPGAEGVLAGIAAADRGYRPVPLYNALPAPLAPLLLDPLTNARVAVNVLPIMAALRNGATDLARLDLPKDAPPAFLLDANRAGQGRRMLPGEFDNRSVCFTTDFPSTTLLAFQGIRRGMLIQKDRSDPHPDLAHTLRRWQEAGLRLEFKQLELPDPPAPLTVSRPRWYRAMFQRALAAVGLRRAPDGGFGSWVRVSSSGG